MKPTHASLVSGLVLCLANTSWADPCGMVPPIWTGDGPAITRIGAQQTYVFYKDGIESFVIRPGFQGKVEEFGMLIPFPSPPAVRKVPDEIFPHIAAAIDPPRIEARMPRPMTAMARGAGGAPGGNRLAVDQVKVLRQEAVGMYEVAVLEAGSARALQVWMDDHGYQYPGGMDDVTEDYVEAGWCFVAVKTRVGPKAQVTPRPGMREADPSLPPGASFDGHVQAMGFRFKSEELVVPMRLSAFNAGQLRNIVYLLSDKPLKAERIPEHMVRRQLPGAELYRNLNELLAVTVDQRWLRGRRNQESSPLEMANEFVQRMWENLRPRRNPADHNRYARQLFAGDLLAAREQRLSHPHEEREKALLNVGEALGLRGEGLDALHEQALAAERGNAISGALEGLKEMTLTVIDGDFPRNVIADANLTFVAYEMPQERNVRRHYDARLAKAPEREPQVFVFVGDAKPVLQSTPEGAGDSEGNR